MRILSSGFSLRWHAHPARGFTGETPVPLAQYRILKAALVYFAMVFGAGFLLGPIRILWVVPVVGTRIAELIEAPIMLAVTIISARWIVRRFAVPFKSSSRLAMGVIALALLLIAEFTLVLWLRGLTIRDYLDSRDPVSETVYYLMLALFALMPLLLARVNHKPRTG